MPKLRVVVIFNGTFRGRSDETSFLRSARAAVENAFSELLKGYPGVKLEDIRGGIIEPDRNPDA